MGPSCICKSKPNLHTNHLTKPALHALEYKHNRCTETPPTCFGIPWVSFSVAITTWCT